MKDYSYSKQFAAFGGNLTEFRYFGLSIGYFSRKGTAFKKGSANKLDGMHVYPNEQDLLKLHHSFE